METTGQFHAPVRFTFGERVLGSHSTGNWMGLKAGLDDVERRKKFIILNSKVSAVQPVALLSVSIYVLSGVRGLCVIYKTGSRWDD
jgi:hypothetical protein